MTASCDPWATSRAPAHAHATLGFTHAEQCGNGVCLDVFTLKYMCTTMVTVTPNMHWYMVWNVVKAVHDALAHVV